MDADTSALRDLAARLRALDAVGVKVANDALPEVLAAARATAAAGTTPEGDAWQPTKTGKRPLQGAAGKITAVVSGSTKAVITLVLRGVEVYHHFGTSRLPPRRILPDAGSIPDAMTAAVRAAAARVVDRIVRGAR